MRRNVILVLTLTSLAPNLIQAAVPLGPDGLPNAPCDPPTAQEQMPPGMTYTVQGYVTEGCGGNAPFAGYDVEIITHLTFTNDCEPPPVSTWSKDRVFTTAVTANDGSYFATFTSDQIQPEIPPSTFLGTLKVRVRVLDPETGELVQQSVYLTEDVEGSRNFPIDILVTTPFAPTMLTDRMTAQWTSHHNLTDFVIAWTENSTNVDHYLVQRRIPGSDWETVKQVAVDPDPKFTQAISAKSAVVSSLELPLFGRQTYEIVDQANVFCGDTHEYRVAAVNNCTTVYTEPHTVEALWYAPDLDPNILYTINGQLTGCVFFDPAAYRVDVAVNAFYADPNEKCPNGPNFELVLGGLPTDAAGRFTFDFALTEITDLIPVGYALKSMYILPQVYHVETGQRLYTRDKIFLTRFDGPYALDIDIELNPPTPTNLRMVGNTTSSISLAWDYDAPTSEEPKEFKVFSFNTGSMVRLKTTNRQSATITGLAPDSEHRFKVTAVYDCGESGSSQTATGRTERAPDTGNGGNNDNDGNTDCTKPEIGFFTGGLIMDPTFPEPDEPFSVYWEIANFGQTETGAFKDLVELDNGAGNGGETYTESFPSIPAEAGNASVYWRQIDHPGLPAGNHHWYVYLDSENEVDECNENNNISYYGQLLNIRIGEPQPLSFAAELARADLDADDDVDADDLQRVLDCRGQMITDDGGPGLLPPCLMSDINQDNRIDDLDVDLVAQQFTGPIDLIAQTPQPPATEDPIASETDNPVANNDPINPSTPTDVSADDDANNQPPAAGMCGAGVGLSLSFGLLGLSCISGSTTGRRRRPIQETDM